MLALFALAVIAACGASDRRVDVDAGGEGGDGSGNAAGRGASAGNGDPSAGAGDASGEGGASGAGPGGSVPCENEALRCLGDSPERCDDGVWVTEPTCGGDTPVCSNGVCAPMKIHGSISTVATATLGVSIRLVDHGFLVLPTSCATVRGAEVCVTGELRP